MSVGNVLGFPLGECVAKFDNTAVSKAFSNQSLYTHQGQSSALYRVTWYVCLTKAASVSSWIGGINGFQIIYNPSEPGVPVTSPANPISTGQYNTPGVTLGSGVVMCAVVPGSIIGFSFGYASSGTPAVYSIHVRVEYLGDSTPFYS